MNCTSARFALAVIQPNSPDSMVPEFDAELAHVRECPECQAFRSTLQRSDRMIAGAMRNVAIPSSLKSRLLGQLALLNDESQNQVAGSPEFAAEHPGRAELFKTEQNNPLRQSVADDTAEQPTSSAIPTAMAPAATTSAQPLAPTKTEHAATRITRGVKRRSLLTFAGLAAAILMCFGLWWLVNRDMRHRLPIGDVLAMCQNLPKPGAVPFQHGFNFELPTSTLPVTRNLEISTATGLHFGGSSEDGPEMGAVFSFSIKNFQQRSLVPAFLIVIDLTQIDVPDLSPDAYSFASAHIYYPKPSEFPTRVWREGQQLYICYAKSTDSAVLELLLPQSSHS